ncbi:ISAs1 family transposase [Neopusillimonas aromaticivorans]|uniref:ISAs1 family transposase n=1 Tax=Neopusillimonas aromaticivorans TaxID=2979868 RepID=UPI002594E5A1|nr:ISAs1 family transposase [Neopusillimonas aromaticivorans]WJJ93578.1 ISAs1 family transposase [Neopusillimonas aromaticivorans]
MLIDTPSAGVVAIDGKTVRGSSGHKGAIHMVNTWASGAGISLGRYKVDAKSNEITAVPELLNMLAIRGVLTLDAMVCQKCIAKTIRKNEADYLLAVKSNQRTLHEDVLEHFDRSWQVNLDDAPGDNFCAQQRKKHGRLELRQCWVMHDMELPVASGWQAKTITAVQLDRTTAQKGTSLIWYFIGSKELTADEVLQAKQQHWRVENPLHRVFGYGQVGSARGLAPCDYPARINRSAIEVLASVNRAIASDHLPEHGDRG